MQDCSGERIRDVGRQTIDSYLKIVSHSYPLLAPATFLMNVSLLCAAHFLFYRTGESCTGGGGEMRMERVGLRERARRNCCSPVFKCYQRNKRRIFVSLEGHEMQRKTGISPGSRLWKRPDDTKAGGDEEEYSSKSERPQSEIKFLPLTCCVS